MRLAQGASVDDEAQDFGSRCSVCTMKGADMTIALRELQRHRTRSCEGSDGANLRPIHVREGSSQICLQ